MPLGAVLPLKILGSYGAEDLVRATILLRSLQRFAEPGLFDRFLVVAPDDEVDAVDSALSAWRHLSLSVVAESDIAPALRRYPKLRGWRRQQILKLAVAEHLRSPFYLTFDADVICLKPLGYDRLLPRGRALLQYEPRRNHPRWWASSARILAMSPGTVDADHGMSVTPAILSTRVASAVGAEISRVHGVHWIDFLAGLHDPARLRNWLPNRRRMMRWTEYSLYYLGARKLGLVDAYHVLAGTSSNPTNLLAHDCHPFESWDVIRSFTREGGLFCSVGSKTMLPSDVVWRKVAPFIDSGGMG